MGTNYYLEEELPCPTCARPFERLHIGKSSAGWCFALHEIPERGLTTLDAWMALWAQGRIFDEYGEEIEPDRMRSIVTERSGRGDTAFDFDRNYAEPGPNGLVRAKIGPYCTAHGIGTWDMIPGEFS